MRERVTKLPTVVNDGGNAWRVLERTGNVVFIESQPKEGIGKRRWDVTFVKVDVDGMEYITQNYNFDGVADSPTFNKEQMYQAFKRTVEETEKRARERARQAAADAARELLNIKWDKQCDYARGQQSALIEELKRLTADGGIDVFDKKRVKEICSTLAAISYFFHHGKGRTNE